MVQMYLEFAEDDSLNVNVNEMVKLPFGTMNKTGFYSKYQ